jgi:hypothetical protein
VLLEVEDVENSEAELYRRVQTATSQTGRGWTKASGGGQAVGISEQTLGNWRKAAKAGKLGKASGKPITAEQMELSRLRAEHLRLRMEMEIIKKGDHKKSSRVLCEGVAVKYAWIEGQRGSFALEALCKALGVSPSGFACWKRGGGCSKRLSDAQLLTLIHTIHAESTAHGVFSSPAGRRVSSPLAPWQSIHYIVCELYPLILADLADATRLS